MWGSMVDCLKLPAEARARPSGGEKGRTNPIFTGSSHFCGRKRANEPNRPGLFSSLGCGKRANEPNRRGVFRSSFVRIARTNPMTGAFHAPPDSCAGRAAVRGCVNGWFREVPDRTRRSRLAGLARPGDPTGAGWKTDVPFAGGPDRPRAEPWDRGVPGRPGVGPSYVCL